MPYIRFCPSESDHNVIELLPGDVGDSGGVGGVTHGEQHQQLLVGWAAKQGPEHGANLCFMLIQSNFVGELLLLFPEIIKRS